MSFTFIIFFLTYGAVHYYLFCKIKTSFNPSLPVTVSLVIFFAVMIIAPIMVHFVERYGGIVFARIFACFTYSWLGLVFVLMCLLLFFDICRFFVHVASYILKSRWYCYVPAVRSLFVISLSLSALIFIYGLFEAVNIRAERIVLESRKIPKSAGRIRIVHISDLHIGTIVYGSRLARIVAKIDEAKPDLLVSTGDLVDGQGDGLFTEYGLLEKIKPPLGKFAVTGNHEFYAGIARAVDFTGRAGFIMLRGKGITTGGLINVAGIDDSAARRETASSDISFEKILRALPKEKFTLYLCHRPVVEKRLLNAFDLQLSGHTHKGQIFPFSIITGLFFPMQAGYFPFSPGAALYVSRGAGTWGPPIRFLSPPEITIIDLTAENTEKR